LLRVDNVSFSYGRRGRDGPSKGGPYVLQDVSFEVRRGTVLGLLGPNGSGKTTLLRLMAGTLTPLGGHIALDGREVRLISRRDLARRIAVVPQDTHSTFDFTALDIVLMGRYPHLGPFTLEGADDLAVARDALTAVGAVHLGDRPFGTLSGGEKQRVVIAGALAQASDLLLLDEPTAALDLGYQIEIGALLTRLNRDRGTTMVISTHDLNLAAALCTEIVLLQNGRALAHGPTDRVLTASNVRALYGVEAEVQFHPRARRLTVVPIARV